MFQKGTESAKTGCFYMKVMTKLFKHEGSSEFLVVKRILAIFCAALQPPSANLIAAALEDEMRESKAVVGKYLSMYIYICIHIYIYDTYICVYIFTLI
jgi:hypothetical protein